MLRASTTPSMDTTIGFRPSSSAMRNNVTT
jgi:hypothetical protein